MVKSDGAASFCQKSIYQELLCKSRVILALVWAFSNVHSAVLTSHRVPSGNIGQYKVICAHSWLNNRPDSLKGNKRDALYCQLANVELPSYKRKVHDRHLWPNLELKNQADQASQDAF